jgi:hypothetical protein
MSRINPSRLGRWSALLLLLAGALPVLAQAPSITKYGNINVGSVVAGATTGTVTLNVPAGDRTATGGTQLGTSVGVSLGPHTLSGKPKDGWAVNSSSAIPFTLTGSNGGTMQVTAVDLEPSTTNTGTFPTSGTTSMFYLGVTVSVGTSATTPAGSYTGNWTELLRDTTSGATTTMTYSVTVKVDPVITLTQLTSLQFGGAFRSATAGTVVLAPAGARSATGGVTLSSLLPTGPATFTVTGSPSATYAITLPASVTLSGPSGATLTATALTSTPSGTGTLDPTGKQTLAVGGTLNVAANQVNGDYSGTFNVTVAYN